MSKTVTLSLVNLDIDHGKNVLTVAVPEHEIRVLQFVHGGDKVRRSDLQEGDEQEFHASADAEIDRMYRKYYRINAPDPVARAYPSGPSQLEQYDFVLGRDGEFSKPAASLVKKNKPAKAAKAAK